MIKAFKTVCLGNKLTTLYPPVNFYLEQIDGLKYTKINRAFWDMLTGDQLWKEKYLKIHDQELIDEVLKIIKNIDNTDIILAVSTVGDPKTINCDLDKQSILANKIIECLPDGYLPHYACFWKLVALDGRIEKLFQKIKDKNVVVVGMQHLSELKNKFKFTHYELNLKSSQKGTRDKVLDDLKSLANDGTIFLFQAGDLFATWLIYHLKDTNCTLIDMGRSLDILCPDRELCKTDKEIDVLYDFKNQQWMNK